jgi:hypothetical protein
VEPYGKPTIATVVAHAATADTATAPGPTSPSAPYPAAAPAPAPAAAPAAASGSVPTPPPFPIDHDAPSSAAAKRTTTTLAPGLRPSVASWRRAKTPPREIPLSEVEQVLDTHGPVATGMARQYKVRYTDGTLHVVDSISLSQTLELAQLLIAFLERRTANALVAGTM